MIWSLFLCVLVCKTLKKKWMRVRKCVYFKKRVSDRGVVGLINVPFPFLPTMVGQENFLNFRVAFYKNLFYNKIKKSIFNFLKKIFPSLPFSSPLFFSFFSFFPSSSFSLLSSCCVLVKENTHALVSFFFY